MMQNDVLDLARQSAASDLAFLLKAKEQAKARLRDDATQENIAAFRRAKGAVEEEIRRLQQGGDFVGMVIKTQKESVEFLTNAGFKISTSQFNRDFWPARWPERLTAMKKALCWPTLRPISSPLPGRSSGN